MSEVLFIGGANDGVRMDVPLLPRIVLPRIVLSAPADIESWQSMDFEERMKTEAYRREVLRLQEGPSLSEFSFYVVEGMLLSGAVQRLFAHYRPVNTTP